MKFAIQMYTYHPNLNNAARNTVDRSTIIYDERLSNGIYPAGYMNDTVYLRVCEVTVLGTIT